jgi:hypothetical protein
MSALHTEYISKLYFFDFDRKPENIPTPETLLSSLYRQLGLASHQNENKVWQNSESFKKIVSNHSYVFKTENLTSSHFKIISEKLIASNRSKEQELKNKHFLYLKPIVPEIGSISHSSRISSNPWNPGAMILEEILHGCENLEEFEKIKDTLIQKLKVGENDDIWSKFIQNELSAIINTNNNIVKINGNNRIHSDSQIKFYKRNYAIPINKELNSGLKIILEIKESFSRQRWINILESYLRFFLFMSNYHKLHYCNNFVESILTKNINEITFQHIFRKKSISINEKRKNIIELSLRKHLFSNVFLYKYLIACNIDLMNFISQNNYSDLFEVIINNISKVDVNQILSDTNKSIKNEHSQEINDLNKGTTKNLKEFFEYVGRKREVTNFNNITDINYLFSKDNLRDYILQPGIGLIYTIVLIASKKYSDESTTISANDLSLYFKSVGVNISTNEISKGYIGKQLNLLGLFIETPDSEGGIQIKKPLS